MPAMSCYRNYQAILLSEDGNKFDSRVNLLNGRGNGEGESERDRESGGGREMEGEGYLWKRRNHGFLLKVDGRRKEEGDKRGEG